MTGVRRVDTLPLRPLRVLLVEDSADDAVRMAALRQNCGDPHSGCGCPMVAQRFRGNAKIRYPWEARP
jgi:hypothetical protein